MPRMQAAQALRIQPKSFLRVVSSQFAKSKNVSRNGNEVCRGRSMRKLSCQASTGRGMSASVIGSRMDDFRARPGRREISSTLPDAVTGFGELRTADFRQYPARRMLSAFRGKHPGIPSNKLAIPD